MKIAVVSPQYGDLTTEDNLVIRRVAGCLAIDNAVDILYPRTGDEAIPESDGAFSIVPFVETDAARVRHRPIIQAAFGSANESDDFCDCDSNDMQKIARSLPGFLQDELARGMGGNSTDLFAFLKKGLYDVVVFAGYRFASTRFGIDYVPSSARIILLPLAREEPTFWLPTYDSTFAKPERILVSTQTEERLVLSRIGKSARHRLVNVRFVLKVNGLAEDTSPIGLPEKSFILAGSESLSRSDAKRMETFAAVLSIWRPNVKLVVVGPRTRLDDESNWYHRPIVVSRTDVWRWMRKALAYLDPRPRRLLGRDVLEAYLVGTPVLVSRGGGANAEHADEGNGGLWFSGISEVVACLDMLEDDHLSKTLAHQGREYALREYGEPDAFIQRVSEAVFN